MAGEAEIDTDGLRDFRRDLKALDRNLDRELARELRATIRVVAAEAAALAPRRTGRLAASYRPFVTSRAAGIRSSLPQAPVFEYGGTISPKGTPIKIRQVAPVTEAVGHQANRIVEKFGDAVENAARHAGWH